MATIDCLPYEVLCIIFDYLSIDDLVNTVPVVCHKWRKASQDILLWRNRTFKPTKFQNVEHVVFYLQRLPRLHHVDLSAFTHDDYRNIDDILCLLCQRFPELQTLLLGICALYSNIEMSRLIYASNNLTSLSLKVNAGDNSELLHAVCSAPNLQCLSLTDFTVLEYTSAEFICNVVRYCHCLKTLKLSLVIGDLNKLFHVIEMAKHILTCFELYASHNFQQALLHNIFMHCCRLKTLKFSTMEETHELMNLANFGKLPCLTELVVSNFLIMPDSLIQLFFQNSWVQLEILSLKGVRTIDNLLFHIVFERCPNLQSLDVSHGNISDVEIRSLCENCANLKYLCVSYTDLTDVSLAKLYKCPLLETLLAFACRKFTSNVVCHIVKCANLKIIDLSNNPWMTDRDVEQILKCPILESLRIGYCESVSGIFFQNVKCFPVTLREIELSRFVHEDFYRFTCQKLQSLKVTTVDKYSEYRLANDSNAYP